MLDSGADDYIYKPYGVGELKSEPAHTEAGQTADEDMNPIPNAGIASSDAFDAEGQRPVLERYRQAR